MSRSSKAGEKSSRSEAADGERLEERALDGDGGLPGWRRDDEPPGCRFLRGDEWRRASLPGLIFSSGSEDFSEDGLQCPGEPRKFYFLSSL